MNIISKIKAKLKRLMCRHNISSWYTKSQQFYNLSGETQYLICDECGKEISTIFVKYD